MAAPATTVWDLEPHSRAKHAILERYMQAWTAILGQAGFPEIVYIDGFAGPGRYSNGEDGSPVIALKAALGHQNRIRSRIRFLFVEERKDRADTLEEILAEIERPSGFSVTVAGGTSFEMEATRLITEYRVRGRGLPPTFAFIDPFGWSGVPFHLVRSILSFPRCEVLVTFMYEEINRFIGHPLQERNFDSYFGTERWRDGITLTDPRERNRFFHDLYLSQLHESAGSRYVRSFEMRNDRDVTDYFLFYATQSPLGLRKMKEAMWRVDPSGEFRFSDATDSRQLVLFGREPRYDILQEQIRQRFEGSETTVGEIENFVVEETAFRETHHKRVLRELETSRPPRLFPIDSPANRRVGTYADPALRVRFT